MKTPLSLAIRRWTRQRVRRAEAALQRRQSMQGHGANRRRTLADAPDDTDRETRCRRSAGNARAGGQCAGQPSAPARPVVGGAACAADRGAGTRRLWQDGAVAAVLRRSEEHTSELQSLMRTSYAVFCYTK